MAEEDEVNNKIYRFAIPEKVNFNLLNSGQWEALSDGGCLWRLKISSPESTSLYLTYNQFFIPSGGKFFIYSEDKTQYLGAFTEKNNRGTQEDIKGFVTGIISSSSIILEYYEPKLVTGQGVISISTILKGYRSFSLDEEIPQLRNNNKNYINVNCEEGDSYQQEKNAIALVVYNGGRASGFLLNNYAGDYKPYFMSADHCFERVEGICDDYEFLEDCLFYWNFEDSCENETSGSTALSNKLNSTPYTVGAEKIASGNIYGHYDFAFLKLKENPADIHVLQPYYLGWNRSFAPSFASGVSISHPRGLPKKIAFKDPNIGEDIQPNFQPIIFDPVTNSDTWPTNSLWTVPINRGFITYGSSGSPLLNPNREVIGVLVRLSPDNDTTLYYLPFSRIWYKLDPTERNLLSGGNNIQTLSGLEYPCSHLIINEYIFQEDNSNVFYGCKMTFDYWSGGFPNDIYFIAEKKIIIPPNNYIFPNTYFRIGTASSNFRSNSVSKEKSIPETLIITSDKNINADNLSELISMNIFTILGQIIYFSDIEIDIHTIGLENGIYIIEKKYNDGNIKREKVILKK